MLIINITMNAEHGVVTTALANGEQWLTVDGREYMNPADNARIDRAELIARVCGTTPSAALSAQLDPIFAPLHIRRMPDGRAYTYTLIEHNGMVSVRRKDLTPRKRRGR